MGIGKRIKEARERRNLTQTELGKLIGVTGSAITNYENEVSHPKEPILYKLISALEIDANFLFQDVVPQRNLTLTIEETDFIESFRSMDSHGKRAVKAIFEEELKRMEEEKESDVIELKTYTIPEYDVPVSAGTGQYLDYSSCEITELSEQPPKGADFIVHVSGDSMEPTYQDGDRLFVSKNKSLSYGDIGIFYIEGNVYVKEYGKDGLISHNKNYSIIPGREEIECIGKVIGKVE